MNYLKFYKRKTDKLHPIEGYPDWYMIYYTDIAIAIKSCKGQNRWGQKFTFEACLISQPGSKPVWRRIDGALLTNGQEVIHSEDGYEGNPAVAHWYGRGWINLSEPHRFLKTYLEHI